jgi:ribonucleoside-diphosphate reductase alpha chain
MSAVVRAKIAEEPSAVKTSSKPTLAGVEFPKFFTARTEPGKTPYDEVQWETRTATIGNDKGSVIFEQRDIEVPADWSQTATNIVASKYFHGKLGSPAWRNWCIALSTPLPAGALKTAISPLRSMARISGTNWRI